MSMPFEPEGIDVEVYALALLETNEIQGLIGIRNDFDSVYIHWACTAPQNNKHDFGKQKYAGVGGHLFAIAIDKSVQWGHDHDAECPCFYQINERYPIFQLEPDDEARLMTLRNMPEQ